MAELSKQQIEQAAKAMHEARTVSIHFWEHVFASDKERYRKAACAAAPYLQLPWDEPTYQEVVYANTKGGISSYLLVPTDAAETLITRFVNLRNAALQPKPVDPRREKIIDAIHEKAIQKVCDYYPHLKGSGDDFIMKMTPGMVMFAERAIRAERERDGAVRTLQTVRSGFSASHYVARVIDAWSQAAHPANGGSTMANEYPYDQTSNQPAQVGDFHQAVLDSRAAEQAVTHADPVPSPLPESVRKPDYTSQSAPEPEEQGEQQICASCHRPLPVPFGDGDYSCATCGMGMVEPCEHWRNIMARSESQPASTAPAQPELEPQWLKELKNWSIEDYTVASIEYGAALRENQQLRRQVTAAQALASEEEASKNAVIIKLEAAEQQLAQIRDAKIEMPEVLKAWNRSNTADTCLATEVSVKLDSAAQTIAALRLDNAQKDKRIAELEGGK